MNSLRSQRIDLSAASVVAVASVAAGLAGILAGMLTVRPRSRRQPVQPEQTKPRVVPPAWKRIDEFQAQLDASEDELESLRRDYELDTGLLKLEVRRLSELLDEQGRIAIEDTDGDKAGNSYHPIRIVETTTPVRRPIRFSSLERLADEGDMESGSG